MATWRQLLEEFTNALKEDPSPTSPKERHMVTWRDILEFTNTLSKAELKKEIYVSNPSKKLHFVSYVCCQTHGYFPNETNHIRTGPKPAARTNQIYTNWETLIKFIGSLKEKELDQQAFISSPQYLGLSSLHVITSCRKIVSNGGHFARGTILLQAGKKNYKYWFSHFEEGRICVGRGFKELDEYKFLQLDNSEKPKWSLDKEWQPWNTNSSGAYTAFQKETIKLNIKEITEKAMQKVISVEGTSKVFEKSFKKKEENKEYKYWYEHRGNRYGGTIHLYRGSQWIEEECRLDMSTGIWVIEKKWSKKDNPYLSKDIIPIPFSEVDKFLSLVGTSSVFNWQVCRRDSKIYKYWYIHIIYPKCEQVYLCRGEKDIEEYIIMKKLFLSASVWGFVQTKSWSKWHPTKAWWWSKGEKELVEITDHYAHEILSSENKRGIPTTKKIKASALQRAEVKPDKYWYIHIADKQAQSIYLYCGAEDIEAYKRISVKLIGDPPERVWKLHWMDDANWNRVPKNYSPPIPKLKESLVEISKSEVERLLSIVGKPDTFDCKTHIHKIKTDKKAEKKEKEYKYWYWVAQKNDLQGRIKQRCIYLCRGYQKAQEYCLLEIVHNVMPKPLSRRESWEIKKRWVPWVEVSSLLNDVHAHNWKIVTRKLKQISKEDADKIMSLEGAEKTFICRKIIDWPGSITPPAVLRREYKYSYWAEQSGSGSGITHRRICLFRNFHDEYSYKILSIHQQGILSKWKSEVSHWKSCGKLTFGQIVGVGRKIKLNEITKYQANHIQNLVGKSKLYCCRRVINWQKGESRNHPQRGEYTLHPSTSKKNSFVGGRK